MKGKKVENSRRKFLKKSALIAGGIAIVPASVVLTDRKLRNKIFPSGKINMAFCGIGNRGGRILYDFMKTGLVNNVAMCDVDMGAEHTLNSLKYFPDVPKFQDFREMFDKMGKKIDAVCVGTPDFSHFPITILAMSLGKHVYVEKPLTRTFHESELLLAAEKKYDVVTQMGNQGHSEQNYFQFKSWVEAGIIKDITKITGHMNRPRRWHGWDTSMTSFPKGQPVPETMNWDVWLGTAQHHDYHKNFVNGQWRCWYDFGMGALGDWGAHIIDTAHQFLDLGLPYEVDPVMIEGANPLFYPQASTIEFKFPERKNMPPLTLSWYDGVNNIPEVPVGYGVPANDSIPPVINEGMMKLPGLSPGKEIYGKDLTFRGGTHGGTLSIIPKEAAEDMKLQLPVVPESPSNHFTNFANACMGKEKTRSPFSISAPLSQVFVLGTMAQRLGVKLRFDRKKKQITNNELANQLLVGTPPRRGWEEFYRL